MGDDSICLYAGSLSLSLWSLFSLWCVHMRAHACTCGDQGSTWGCLPQSPPTLVFETVLFSEPQVCCFGHNCLGMNPGSACLCPFECWGCRHRQQGFPGSERSEGSELRPSGLHSEPVTHCSLPSSLESSDLNTQNVWKCTWPARCLQFSEPYRRTSLVFS